MGDTGERSRAADRPALTPTPSVERVTPTAGSAVPAASRLAPHATLVQRVVDGLAGPPRVDRLPGVGPATKIRRVGGKKIVKGDSAPMENKDHQNAPSASDLEKWKPVWSNFPEGLGDEAKLDELLARFKTNAVGFKYVGASRPFSLNGDCGSLVRTFIAIAESQLQVEKGTVTVGYYNKGKAWYVPPGVHEIDPTRHPNMSNGGYLFAASHVWAKVGATVYDVLFGAKDTKGIEVDEYKNFPGPDGKQAKHFRIGAKWFRSEGDLNRYVEVPDPTSAPVATPPE